jgi:hypothetical protein
MMNRSHLLGLAIGVVVGSLATAILLRRSSLEPARPSTSAGRFPQVLEGAPEVPLAPETRVDLGAGIKSALDAHEDRRALALLRALVSAKPRDGKALSAILVEILGKSAENSFFRRHFESVFDDADVFPLLRLALEEAQLTASVRKLLIRTLSESGHPEAAAYLIERIRRGKDPQELADLIEVLKSGPALQEELKSLLLDPSRPREARIAAVNRLAQGRTPESQALLTQALSAEQDPAVLLAMVGQGVGWGTPALRDALLGLFQDFSNSAKNRQQALDYLSTLQDPKLESLIAQTARSDPDPEIRQQASIELLHLLPPVAGMFIQQIVPNSQAQSLGLRRGDIVLEYNGQAHTSLNSLADAVGHTLPQDQVPLRVYRDGQIMNLMVRGGRIGISADFVTPK